MRFSVLTPTYYSERFDSLEAIAEHIFSDTRMALRFHIFEKLVLPSLLRQTDLDFTLVILTSEHMPEVYLQRMADLLEPVPNIHLVPVGTARHYQLLKLGYNMVDPGDATHRLMFRLDDDDAMDDAYIARMKHIGRTLIQIHPLDTPYAIAFNRGFYVRINQEGENEVFDAVERAPLSTGTAILAPLDYPRNPYRYNHRALGQHYNLYTDIQTPAYIRTIHGDNKSNPTQMGLVNKMRPKKIDEQLRAHFGLGISDLKAL
jgi:hypothetical protein